MNKINFSPLFITLCFLTSCGFIQKNETVLILDTKPTGADVKTHKGEILGQTPLKLPANIVKKYQVGEYLPVSFSKMGYRERTGYFFIQGVQEYKTNLNKITAEDFVVDVINKYPLQTSNLIKEALEAQGLILVRNFKRAEIKLNELIKKYPNISPHYTMLATVFIARKDKKKALPLLLQALKLNPEDSTAKKLHDQLIQ